VGKTKSLLDQFIEALPGDKTVRDQWLALKEAIETPLFPEMYQQYAEENGKDIEELTKEEKRQAIMNAVQRRYLSGLDNPKG